MSAKRRLRAEIQVLPYIDVMLVLLIIFMVAAPFINQGITVDLPKLSHAPKPLSPDEPLIVTVNATGDYFFNQEGSHAMPLSQLVLSLRARQVLAMREGQEIPPVFIRGDQHTAYQHVAQLLGALQHQGVEKLSLVTESLESPS